MAIPVTLDLGTLGAGWIVYFNVFSPDDTEVWNDTAFFVDSDANQNAGAIAMVEDGGDPGRFEGDFPAEITDVGVYPIRARRRIGGSVDVTVDTLLTYDVASNAVHILSDGTAGELTYHQCYWSELADTAPRNQIRQFWEGSGRPILISRLEGPAETVGTYRFDVTTPEDLTTIIFSVNGALDEATGDIIVNPTIAQRALLERNRSYLGRLWRTDSDDNTDVLAIVVISTK